MPAQKVVVRHCWPGSGLKPPVEDTGGFPGPGQKIRHNGPRTQQFHSERQAGNSVLIDLEKKKPSEYVKQGKIYFSCEAGESLLGQALDWVGEDRVAYASDFPHWDAEFPENIEELLERKDITDRAKKKVLYENGRVLYGILRKRVVREEERK